MQVPRTYISKIENGKAIPTLGSLERLAGALEVDICQLVRDARSRREEEVAAILADPFLAEIAGLSAAFGAAAADPALRGRARRGCRAGGAPHRMRKTAPEARREGLGPRRGGAAVAPAPRSIGLCPEVRDPAAQEPPGWSTMELRRLALEQAMASPIRSRRVLRATSLEALLPCLCSSGWSEAERRRLHSDRSFGLES